MTWATAHLAIHQRKRNCTARSKTGAN
jgi:hypothetical protein